MSRSMIFTTLLAPRPQNDHGPLFEHGYYIFNRLSQSLTINIFTPVRTYTSMISTTIQQEELEKQTYRATIRAWAIIFPGTPCPGPLFGHGQQFEHRTSVFSPGNFLTAGGGDIVGVWGVLHRGAGGRAPWEGRGKHPFRWDFLNEGLYYGTSLFRVFKGLLSLGFAYSFSTPLVVLSDKHSSKGHSRACSTILCMYMSPSLPVRVNLLPVTAKGKLCTSAGKRQWSS